MSEEITPNIPLLRKTVEWVEEQAEQPENVREWLQAKWMLIRGLDRVHDTILDQYHRTDCGTAKCMAGKVCQDEFGLEAVSNPHFNFSEEAQKLLGLDYHQAQRLFNPYNDSRAIRNIAEDIAGERL